jgi:hypothetical protein
MYVREDQSIENVVVSTSSPWIKKTPQAGANGESSSLNSRERDMALILWRWAVEDGEAPVVGGNWSNFQCPE